MKKIYTIDDNYVDTRLDRWFKKVIEHAPQSFIEKNLRKGNIKVNNKKVKNSYKLQLNDKIVLFNIKFTKKKQFSRKEYYNPTKKEVNYSSDLFIHSNNDFVVLNKPSGIAVQSGTKSKRNILDILRKTKEFIGSMPYPVHRIDKETTGVLIVAKNRKYAQLFTTLFRLRKIKKMYLGIVSGELHDKKGKLEDILYHYEGEKRFSSKAITYYEVIDSNKGYSLLRLIPYTGRKHQLRKQLSIRGHFIIGDNKYKSFNKMIKRDNNLMLHAHKISFTIDNLKYNFSAEIPKDFKNLIKKKYLKNVL